MDRQLPRVMDEFFLNLGAAVWGQYEPKWQPQVGSSTSVRSREQRALRHAAARHHQAMSGFQRKKIWKGR